MPGLLPHVDPDGLLEFSVVYTDRALNHMSRSFQGVMKDISGILKEVYHAAPPCWCRAAAPSAWSRGAPVCRRQACAGHPQRLVQLPLDADLRDGRIPGVATVLKARRPGQAPGPWAPAPIAEVQAAIRAEKPAWCLPRTWKPPPA
jgi:hypothetical protein